MSGYERMLISGSSDDLFNGLSYNTSAIEGIGIWMIIALVLAIVGGILTHFLFVKGKVEPKNKFLKWLKDFLAFKTMWIESIVKVFYYIATIFCVLFSFSMISYSFVAFIIMLVLMPVVLRVAYEAVIMFIMIWRNTRDIAENTKKK